MKRKHEGHKRHKYNDNLKLFATYLYLIGGKLLYETLSSNLSLPSLSVVSRTIKKAVPPIIEGEIRIDELKSFLTTRNLPMKVWLSEDATRISNKIQYDPSSNQIVGLVLPLDCNGLPTTFTFAVSHVEDMDRSIASFEKSNYAYVIMAQPMRTNAPSFCLTLYGTNSKFETFQVITKHICFSG